jgi:hypothetical protein
MDMPMNPARTGSIKPNDAPPTCMKNCASGVFEPNFDGSIV